MPRAALASILLLAVLSTCFAPASGAQTAPAASQAAIRPTPQLGKGFDAFPRLAATGPMADRINAGLAAADARGLKALQACRRDAEQGSWTRSVEVAMRGPDFLSFVAHDDYFCGGAYPAASIIPLVYDLATGRPVDWTRLFPKEVVGVASVATGGDGTTLGVLSSRILRSRYLFGLKLEGDCADALDAAEHFMLWPDAKAGGLVLHQEDLPHAVQACGGPVTIPTDKLSGFGTSPRLIDALAAAHRAAP